MKKIKRKLRSFAAIFLAVAFVLSGFASSVSYAIGPDNYNHEANIIEGNGGVHAIGSGEDLSFVFEDSLSQFYGAGLLLVDDEAVDMSEECLVNARTKIITLLSRYLDTLAVGEHHLEALFPDEAQGFAQANFTIIESESDSVVTADPITATYPYYAFVENSDNPWETVWDALDATDTIEYSDSYFDVPSPGDHPELRAASYALALAGFENEADG